LYVCSQTTSQILFEKSLEEIIIKCLIKAKMFDRNIVETTTRITNAYWITCDNNNCIDNVFSKFLLIDAKNKVIYQIILISKSI